MSYFDSAGRPDVLSGGVRMIPVATPAVTHRVGTKRTGNNPATKVLLLHGGPGATHEYLLGFDSYLPGAGVEYHYYDQLGSGWSDRPDDPSLWTIERFVGEVEQVPIRARPFRRELRPLRPVVGRAARHRARAGPPAAPEGPRDQQHDGEHPGLQPVCGAGAHPAAGPGDDRRDQGPADPWAYRGRGTRHTARAAARVSSATRCGGRKRQRGLRCSSTGPTGCA
jgi:pimeloyl-ACP methyl ester carboxylesterase